MKRFVASLLKLRNRHFLAADLLIFLVMPALALALRTDGLSNSTLKRYGASLVVATLLFLVIKLAVYRKGGLYSRFWRYAGVDELGHIAFLVVVAIIIQTAVLLWIFEPLGWVTPEFPRSLPLIEGLLTLVATGALRYSVRFSESLLQQRAGNHHEGDRVVVAGAGSAGVMVVQEMRRNPHLAMKAVAFVDDAIEKQGMRIAAVPVLGRCSDIPKVAHATNARRVIIAMPTAPGKVIREVVRVCEQAGVQPQIVPGMYELLGGSFNIHNVRNVDIEDLLRREPVRTDIAAVGDLLRGRRVLITGGGGSIGRELCRQVLRFNPASLVILGHGENSIFEITNELQLLIDHERLEHSAKNAAWKTYDTRIHPVIADIRSMQRLSAVFGEHRPEVVFHSAAHKHVPLMEENPVEAITNNIEGTQNVLRASLVGDVERFVMISTDKAVNPTSIMGASKRVAELLVHQAARQSGKPYVAVRFGNVLGSRGSVVLTFKQQIAAGGPVTVTHPEVIRYFMTIPEAVQLVLQAATLGQGSEVFMLDMGDPVRIVDLAKDLIELSGLQVGRDIDITFVGLRPGEKLYEELFVFGEQYAPTRHDKVFTVGNASSLLPADLGHAIKELIMAAQNNDKQALLAGLHNLVPEFSSGALPSRDPELDQVVDARPTMDDRRATPSASHLKAYESC